MRIKQQSIEEMLNSFHLNELLRFHNHVKQVLQSTKSQAQWYTWWVAANRPNCLKNTFKNVAIRIKSGYIMEHTFCIVVFMASIFKLFLSLRYFHSL